MELLLDRLPPGAHVLIIRLRSLGDCVLTTPALEILNSARPDLRISVVVESAFAPVFEGNPAVTRILTPRDRQATDFCINFHGGTRSMVLTAASRAPWRAGFTHFRAPWLYNIRIPRAQEILGVDRKVHTAEHLASAMFFLGAARCEIPRARLFPPPAPAGPPYAVIHPFASSPGKTWPAENFTALARALPVEVVVLGSASDDFTPFGEFHRVQGAGLKQVMSLIAGASLFAGNDSGPAHMAAALGIPLLVLFGPSDPVVWAPWRAPSRMLVARGAISSITVAEALAAVDSLRVAA
jgi:ADP-heptose:LPS heptosyltransferase